MDIHKWQPTNVINPGEWTKPFACIILNRPIHFEPDIFQNLWNNGMSHSMNFFSREYVFINYY